MVHDGLQIEQEVFFAVLGAWPEDLFGSEVDQALDEAVNARGGGIGLEGGELGEKISSDDLIFDWGAGAVEREAAVGEDGALLGAVVGCPDSAAF